MASTQARARSLYRSLLRELPNRTGSHTTNATSPLRTSIRTYLESTPSSTESQNLARLQDLQQGVQYLKAQRVYGTLLDRYNPGANMDEDERVRLTARRVGMEMPEEWYGSAKGTPGKFGVKVEGGKK